MSETVERNFSSITEQPFNRRGALVATAALAWRTSQLLGADKPQTQHTPKQRYETRKDWIRQSPFVQALERECDLLAREVINPSSSFQRLDGFCSKILCVSYPPDRELLDTLMGRHKDYDPTFRRSLVHIMQRRLREFGHAYEHRMPPGTVRGDVFMEALNSTNLIQWQTPLGYGEDTYVTIPSDGLKIVNDGEKGTTDKVAVNGNPAHRTYEALSQLLSDTKHTICPIDSEYIQNQTVCKKIAIVPQLPGETITHLGYVQGITSQGKRIKRVNYGRSLTVISPKQPGTKSMPGPICVGKGKQFVDQRCLFFDKQANRRRAIEPDNKLLKAYEPKEKDYRFVVFDPQTKTHWIMSEADASDVEIVSELDVQPPVRNLVWESQATNYALLHWNRVLATKYKKTYLP